MVGSCLRGQSPAGGSCTIIVAHLLWKLSGLSLYADNITDASCTIHPHLVFTELHLQCDWKPTTKHTSSKIPLVMKSQKYTFPFHEVLQIHLKTQICYPEEQQVSNHQPWWPHEVTSQWTPSFIRKRIWLSGMSTLYWSRLINSQENDLLSLKQTLRIEFKSSITEHIFFQ